MRLVAPNTPKTPQPLAFSTTSFYLGPQPPTPPSPCHPPWVASATLGENKIKKNQFNIISLLTVLLSTKFWL